MASTTPTRPGEPCPDPSAHQHHNSKLSEQASTAALYVTKGKGADSQQKEKENPLGPDGKLSSAGAAASLKYANAQDLPSFPSVGLGGGDSAGRAATLAKDYKMKELWQPELSSAGSKAALLAHRDGGKLDLWQATPSKDGNSAAVLAMRGAKSPELDRGYTPEGKQKALLAATLSVNRGRSGSLPSAQPAAYPDSHNSAKNALNAATVSHRQSVKGDGWDSEANQAARVKNLHVNPRYFTGTPDIDIDPDETKHQAALRASATSMAKQMYEYQNRTVLGPDLTGGVEGAGAAAARQQPDQKLDVKQEALRYIHLQDAAHKLAQERLAKIDKDGENARYREYYGYPDQQTSPKKLSSRLSTRGRNRTRAGDEEEEEDSDDEQQARRIRHQMTQLNTGVSAVDEKKRSDDRARLLAAAEKRVHNQMHDMDERVFADTGKVPPAMLEEWEEKARKRAQEDRELAARPENKGKTHIGGGKFIDQAEIDAIAAARLKPTLDEINETAERKRARDEELRLEKEEQEREKAKEKQRQREEKDEQKQIKNEEKAARRQEKEEAKARKEEEKEEARARKEEEKRIAREEQRKSREVASESAAAAAIDEEGDEEDREVQPEKHRSGIFGRVASKLRRDREAREVKKEGAAVSEPKSTSHTGAVVGTGAATAGGVAVADHEHNKAEATEDVPPAVETAEPTATAATASTAPTLERVHTGSQNDPTATVVTPEKPNLERHISTLGHSDDDFSDDEDDFEDVEENDRRRDQDLGLLAGGVGAAGASGVGAYEMAQGSDNKLHPVNEQASAIPDAATNVSKPDETGPAPHTIGPHESDVANIVDPRVKPEPELQRGATDGDVTGPASSTIGPHTTNTANILDPRVQPDLSLKDPRKAEIENEDKHHTARDAAVVGGAGAAGVGAYEVTKGDETGPASNTIGPHSSNIANVMDPRVKPDPEKLGKQKEETVAPAATGSAVGANHSGAPAPNVKTGPDTPLQAQEEPADKEKKGLRGFFGKLRHRPSKSESEPAKLKKDEPKTESPNLLRKDEPSNISKKEEVAGGAAAGAATGVAASDLSSAPKASTDTSSAAPTKASTDTSSAAPKASTDTASAAPKMSTDTNPASPTSASSSKRGETGLRNFSSNSSTERKSTDTDSRGRRSYDKPVSAYLKAEFGLGDLSKGMKLDDKPEEEEEFQEARDHFDENLAPPPAFGAGGKSQSPVRGTRFREEV